MKKNLLFTVVCSSLLVLASCKPSKEEVKTAFMERCNLAVPANIPKDIAKEYCNCSADALLSKYSVEEIAEMEKKMAAGDAEVKNKMMQDVQPCMQSLIQKAQAQQH